MIPLKIKCPYIPFWGLDIFDLLIRGTYIGLEWVVLNVLKFEMRTPFGIVMEQPPFGIVMEPPFGTVMEQPPFGTIMKPPPFGTVMEPPFGKQ